MALDGYTLAGVNLNDETNYGIEAMDAPPPVKRPEWAQAADSDGSSLIRTPLYENRTITLTLRVGPQATMNAALEKIGALNDLLQECEKNPEGSPLVYTPATGTKKYTLYVLTAQITAVPTVNEGSSAGFYVFAPQLTVVLTCKPFAYGTEEEVAAAKSIETGLSTVVLTIPTMAGDVPAEGRLVITDTAAVGRRNVAWGLENRYYNAATSLILAAEAMTPVGGTRSEAANTGAYSPSSTKKTIATTLINQPTVCCKTGVLKHIGTYRVLLRSEVVLGAESAVGNVHARLSYQDGEGPLRANTWQTPVLAGKYVEVDLGTITTTPAVLGAQKWEGQIEAYSKNGAAKDVLHANYLTFVPCAEGYGKARGVRSRAPGAVVAFDNFTTGTLSGSLNTRTPAIGAAWATSGAATDFTVLSTATTRSTTSDASPRYGLIGSALGNASVSAKNSETPTSTGVVVGGVVGRWVDANNYAFLLLEQDKTGLRTLTLGVKIASVTTVLQSVMAAKFSGGSVSMFTLAATLDGGLVGECELNTSAGTAQELLKLAATSSAIATAGALASGKFGIYDMTTSTSIAPRTFLEVTVVQLAGIPYCIEPSQSLEVRSDSSLAEDSTGTYGGPVPEYRGSRFDVPQDGSANRVSRILVKADRNDLEESDQQTIADAFTAQVFATPRYCALPR